MCRSQNVPMSILRMLESREVKHPDFITVNNASNGRCPSDDPFHKLSYLCELTSLGFQLEDILDRSISLTMNSNGMNSISRIYSYLKTARHKQRPDYYQVLCPMLCLRYKLWFAVWHERHTHENKKIYDTKSTYLYYFHPILNKASLYKLPPCIFIRHMKIILYFRVLKKKSNFQVQLLETRP